MENRKFKYDFFISYKHGKRDSKISGYLQKKLEGYKIPKEIKKRCGKEKITRVFRDKEELSVTVDLTLEIEEQLKNTEYLVVMCSPQSKQSQWVNREVETFLKYRGWEYVLPVLIEGEPRDSFPEILNEREMLAADVRGKTFGQIKKKCKKEILRLLAPALKCSYDELRQRNRAYASKRFAMLGFGLAVLALAFGGYAWRQSVKIQENYWKNLESQAGLLADKSTELLEGGNREAALLVAMEALPDYEGSKEKPLVGKAQIALEDALYLYDPISSITSAYPLHTLKMDNSMKKVYALNDEKSVLISCDDKNIIYVWDLATGDLKCKYTLFDELELNCDALYSGLNNSVYICSSKKIVLFDYETGQTIWELNKEEFDTEYMGNWTHYVLSPSKNKMLLLGGEYAWIIDAQTAETIDSFVMEIEGWKSDSAVWNPNEKEIAMIDDGFFDAGKLVLVDLDTKEKTIIKTFDDWISIKVAYKSEDILSYVWVRTNDYSLGYTFSYGDYYVAEVDCNSGEALWEYTGQTVIRDSDLNIRYVYEEDDGEVYDLTIVTAGSEVVALCDGKMWAEFNYDSEIVGTIPNGIGEQHITKNGTNYFVHWGIKVILNEFYNSTSLGLDNIYYAEGIQNKGIVAFPGFGGGTLYVYEPMKDKEYEELEDSNANYIAYSPNWKYRIGKDSSEEDYRDGILKVWNLENDKLVYRQEFFYDYDSNSGDFLQQFGFLNDQYFYYTTYYDFVVIDVETLETVVSYHHEPTGEWYRDQIEDTLCVVDGENPGAYFTDGQYNIYFYSIKDQQCSVIIDEELRSNLQETYFNGSYSLYFMTDPTGKHLFLTNSPYDHDAVENKILVWNVKEGKVCTEFFASYDLIKGINAAFTKDGMSMAFQNKADGLQVMDLTDYSVKKMPILGENHLAMWFSEDGRYIFVYTYDYFLRIYDIAEEKLTQNMECEPATLKLHYFEGDNLYISSAYTSAQPVMYCYRRTEEGIYDCYSIVENCEFIANGKVYVRSGSENDLCVYRHRSLNELLDVAREILDGRELTDIEKQRYSID